MDPNACCIHQENPSVVQCQKHRIGYCNQCFNDELKCRDPQLYCKFRQQCVIWFTAKEREKEEKVRNAV